MADNVLLVTVDSLRKDAFEKYINEADNSVVKKINSDGVSFNRAYATGMGTNSSFPALLTGTMPLSYGGLGPLNPNRPRISSNLKEQGIDSTGGFQCNPFLSRFFNYDEGYDSFEDYQNPLMGVATKIFPRGIELNNPKLERLDDFLHITDIIKSAYANIKGKPRPYVKAETVTNEALNWLDSQDGTFYGWVHYMDVHHPCHPPEHYRSRYGVKNITNMEVSNLYSQLLQSPEKLSEADLSRMRKLYNSAIEYTMDEIERLFEKLEENDQLDNTMVIITSDHGELFGEYGYYGKPERMLDILVNVPLIVINGPEEITSISDDLISLLDIPILLHEALNLEIPDEYEGYNPISDTREYVIMEHAVNNEAVVSARTDDWLFEFDQIRNERRLFRCGKNQKQVDIEKSKHDSAQIAINAVTERLNEININEEPLEETVDGAVEDRLEELGYL